MGAPINKPDLRTLLDIGCIARHNLKMQMQTEQEQKTKTNEKVTSKSAVEQTL